MEKISQKNNINYHNQQDIQSVCRMLPWKINAFIQYNALKNNTFNPKEIYNDYDL